MPIADLLPRKLRLSLAHAVTLRRATSAGVELTQLRVQIANLPTALDGFCLAQVSDLHIGEGMWHPPYTEEAAHLVHAAQPDVLINTGDFFQWEPPIDKVAAVTCRFLLSEDGRTMPRNVAVLGNHDYYAGPRMVDDLKRSLASLGACLLINAATCLRHNGSGITVVGLTEDEPGFERAVEQLVEAERPKIALVHEPEFAERLPPGSADLILAGHTHGGQITLPGLEPFIVRRFCGSHYVHGMYQVNGMPLYINRGLGTTGLPFRVRARPEVTIVRLVR